MVAVAVAVADPNAKATDKNRFPKKVSKEVSSALYHNKKATPLPKKTSFWLFMPILLL